MEEHGGSSLEYLLQRSQIVCLDNGFLKPNLNNLKIILDSVDSSKIGVDCSVAILAVLGPRSCGKSLLTNFLIRCFQFGEEGGWVSDIMKRSESGKPMMEKGFSWGSVSNPDFFQPATTTSGVHLWPEPFLIEKSGGGKKILVWIMHLQQNERDENVEQLEKFVTLTCSRIMEVKWKNEDLRLLEQFAGSILNANGHTPDICGSAVFVVRSKEKVTKPVADEKAKHELLRLVEDPEKKKLYNDLMGHFQHINLAWLKDCEDELNNRNGILNPATMKTIAPVIKKIVELMVDEAEINEKVYESSTVTLGNLFDFIINTVNRVCLDEVRERKEGEMPKKTPVIPSPPEHHKMIHRSCDSSSRPETPKVMHVAHSEKQECKKRISEAGFSQSYPPRKSSTTYQTSVLMKHADQLKQLNVAPDINIPKTEDVGVAVSKSNNFEQQNLTKQQPYVHKALVKTTLKETEEKMEVDDDQYLCELVQGVHHETLKAQRNKRMMTNKVTVKEEVATFKEADQVPASSKKAEHDRKRKEQEERIRRQKAKSEMEETLHVVISKLKQQFRSEVKTRIDCELDLDKKESEITTIYIRLHNNVLRRYRDMVHPKLWNDFVTRVDELCKLECETTLETISKAVTQIKKDISKQFILHGYFTPPKLKQVIQDEILKVRSKLTEDFALEVVTLAGTKLSNLYEEHNLKILGIERNLQYETMDQLSQVYDQQMKRYLKHAPYCPERLQRIHWTLVDKLIDAIKKACAIGWNTNEITAENIASFKDNLNQAFVSFKQANEAEVNRLQKEITKIIQKMKTVYNEKVEEILTKNPNGLDAKTLNKHREVVQTEILKLLEMEIKQKWRPEEPLENHKSVLREHMKLYWPSILDANMKNIQKKIEQDKIESKTLMETRMLGACSAGPSRKPSEKVEPLALPPLVFHLQSSRVTMAMSSGQAIGDIAILENEFGETSTPACVAFSSDYTFIYGSEALANAQNRSISTTGGDDGSINYWTVADFFSNDNLSWSKTIEIDNCEYAICTEFLLGFLFKKLKQSVENVRQGECSAAVIVIPFWLSSQQRIQIKDGARLAGFSDVYLVNEASAAAYNFIRKDDNRFKAGELLVLSESMDIVDAFVYTYTGYENKLQMVSHSQCSFSSPKNPQSHGMFSSMYNYAKKKINAFLTALQFEGTEPTEQDANKARSLVFEAIEIAVQKANENFCQPVHNEESLFICENANKWSKILETFTWDAMDNTEVLTGAAMLSLNPQDIPYILQDKLAYQVQCHSGSMKGIQVSNQDETLQSTVKQYAFTLRDPFMSVSFYQDVNGNEHKIGDLSVMDCELEYQEYLRTHLGISSEAIVELVRVSVVKIYRGQVQGIIYPVVPWDSINWKTGRLSKEQMQKLVELLDIVAMPPQPKNDPAFAQAKANLLQLCKEMTDKINSNQLAIRSQLVKEKVVEQISDAENIANHECSVLENVQKQLELLEKLYQKYDKRNK